MLQVQKNRQSLVCSGQINGTSERTRTNPRDTFKTSGTHEKLNASQNKRQFVPNQPIQLNAKKEIVTQKGRQQICRRNHTKSRQNGDFNLMLKIWLPFLNSAHYTLTTICLNWWSKNHLKASALILHAFSKKLSSAWNNHATSNTRKDRSSLWISSRTFESPGPAAWARLHRSILFSMLTSNEGARFCIDVILKHSP